MHAAGIFSCSLGTILNDQFATVALSLRVIASTPLTITNSAQVSANEPDIQPTNNVDAEDTTVHAGADLALNIAASPNPVQSGASVSYTLQVQNHGPDAATGLNVQFQVPPGLNVTSVPGGCSQAGATVTCTAAGPLANGGSHSFTPIVGQVTVAGGQHPHRRGHGERRHPGRQHGQ